MGTDRFYWLRHRRYVANKRMRWHAETADESFWHDYWENRLNTGYFDHAEQFDIMSDELGCVLLEEMTPDGQHLEAGCGAGFWVAALRKAGLDVEGIEYSTELVEMVNEVYAELPVHYGDALAIDSADNTYASYLSFGVVEHRLEGPEPFLTEAFRVVRPGGKIIITVPNLGWLRRMKARFGQYESQPPDKPFFQYAFTGEEFVSLVERAGFVTTRVQQLYIHRLLLEESAPYRWLNDRRVSDVLKGTTRQLLRQRDGHMLLVVGEKPAP